MGLAKHHHLHSPNISSTICTMEKPFYSSGIWYGKISSNFAVPLLLLQITLVVTATCIVRCLLKPLKQPRIVAEILGALIIGRSFLGMNDTFAKVVFPKHGMFVLSNLSKIGVMYFMLIIGVKIEFTSAFKTGKKAWLISLCGILLPFTTAMFLKSHLGKYLPDGKHLPFGAMVATFVSLTNFPVLHPILAEINLLNSDIGKLAMSLSTINDVIMWGFSIVANSVNTGAINPTLGVFNFLSVVVGMVMFIVLVFRPTMLWIIRKTPEGRPVDHKYIVAIMLFVFIMGFTGDLLGVTTVIGPLIMGLAIPDGPPLGATIVEKTETLTQELLMPAFYARIGEHATGLEVREFVSWFTLHFIITMGFIAKMLGTLLPCLIYKMPFRNAVALGLIMNFKGQFELMNFLTTRDKKILGQRSYNIMVFSSLFVTAITTPIVRKLYKPIRASEASNRRSIQHVDPNSELCILTCTHNEENVPSIINVLQASNSTQPICVYVLHLIELVGRATPLLVAHDKHKRSSNPTSTDRIINAFKIYEDHNVGRVSIQPFICMSPYITMHEDICAFALEKNASIIIVPFHKRVTCDGEFGAVDNAFRTVNPNILAEAPCSVGVLVDRGHNASTFVHSKQFSYNIGVIFLGGADDREALAYANKMAEQSGISLSIMRILPLDDDWDNKKERKLDDELISGSRSRSLNKYRVVYTEEIVKDAEQMFSAICSIEGNYDLFIVGRRHESSSLLKKDMMEWSENPQLGAIGDLLASSDFRGMASVLVMQQHTKARRYIHAV